MKIIKEWKEFQEWKNFLNSCQEIDLDAKDKRKLKALGDELIEKLFLKTKNQLVNRLLSNDASPDYIKWAKQMLAYMKWNIK